MGRLSKCQIPATPHMAWNLSGCLARNSRRARRLLRRYHDHKLHSDSDNSMKRLRFNLRHYFRTPQAMGNSRATPGRRWNGSLHHVTEKRSSPLRARPFILVASDCHFRKQAFLGDLDLVQIGGVLSLGREVRAPIQHFCELREPTGLWSRFASSGTVRVWRTCRDQQSER